MNDLTAKRCLPCEGGVDPLDAKQTQELMKQLGEEWKVIDEGKAIEATFKFRNYFRTLAFVNAAAYIAIQDDHHPDMAFGFNTCTIKYWTHNINGLSENDFICAAKVDALLSQ